MSEQQNRKLAAILFATSTRDYTALMQKHEATPSTITKVRNGKK